MLTAIGMKKNKLQGILLGEAVLITLLGTTAGILLSLPMVVWLNKNPLRFTGEIARVYEQFGFEAIFPTAVEAHIFYIQALIVLSIALLVGLYPLWYVKRLDPVKAMRK
jgi:ABC-type lipoprotein release transport system permease subunit